MTGGAVGHPDVVLLWLESVAPGSAGRTHLDGTVARLKAAGVPIAATIASDEHPASLVDRFRRLGRLISRVRAQRRSGAVLVTRWHPFLAFVSGSWRRTAPIVLLVQGNYETLFESHPFTAKLPFVRRWLRSSLTSADRILVLNEGLAVWVRREVSAAGKQIPVTVLPTGVNPVFLARPEPSDPPVAGRYAAFLGNFASWQGIECLLEAKDDASWPSDLKLVLIGSGGDQEELVRGRAGDDVVWLGRMRPEAAAQVLSQARLSLCPKIAAPSMAETTTPFKMLESAALGVPVVASDIPAQQRMLDESPYGVTFAAGDPHALAEAVARLSNDDQLHAAAVAAARQTATGLSWESNAPVLVAAIDEAAGRA